MADKFISGLVDLFRQSDLSCEKTKYSQDRVDGLTCPSCGKPEAFLYLNNEKFEICCNRQTKCGAKVSLRELFPEDLDKLERKFRPSFLLKGKEKFEHRELGIPSRVYDYTDASGKILFHVCRFKGQNGKKEFRQCRATADHKLVWNIKGVKRVPYSLTEVSGCGAVVIVEGEKDVETLRSLEIVATCNPMGADKWTAELNQYFKNKKVVIIPDNDDRGNKHAIDVANELSGHAKVIKIVELPDLPEKGDTTDWINAGHTKEELFSVIEKAGTWNGNSPCKGISAYDLMRVDLPEPRWAVPNILPEGLTIMGGKPKHGKSILAQNIAVEIACGGKLGKIDVEKGAVVYLALEDTRRRLQDRITDMLKGRRAPKNLLFFNEWRRMNEGGLDDLENIIKTTPDMRLVVIDTLAKFRPIIGGKRNNMYETDYKHIGDIKALGDKYRVSILLIHHLRKMEAEDVMDTFSGTLGLTGASDGLLALVRKTNQVDAELHVTGRDIESTSYALRFVPPATWHLLGKAHEIRSTEAQQKLYDALKEAGTPVSPKELSITTGLKSKYIMKTMPVLIKSGNIRRTTRGLYEYYGDDEDIGEKRDVGDVGDISKTGHRKVRDDNPNIPKNHHNVNIEDLLKASEETNED